jgi:hypothetical protein
VSTKETNILKLSSHLISISNCVYYYAWTHSPYGKILKDSGFSMNLRGVLTTAEEVYEKLIEGISNVYEDVESLGYIDSKKHREEYELFHNEFGVVDGPW